MIEMNRKGVAKKLHYRHRPRLMTVHEVSAYLRVHPGTIYKLVRRHQIPAFHVGRDWHFYIEMIDAWRLAQEKLGG